MEKFLLRFSPFIHNLVFVDEAKLKTFKDDNELVLEDDDCKAER